MTKVISKSGFMAELFSNPLFFAFFALAFSNFDIKYLLLAVALVLFKVHSDAYLVFRMRGYTMHPKYQWLSPIKDILMGIVWVYTLFSRTTQWRGIRFRLGSGSLIASAQPQPAVYHEQAVSQDIKATLPH